jgi:hypothetical protein
VLFFAPSFIFVDASAQTRTSRSNTQTLVEQKQTLQHAKKYENTYDLPFRAAAKHAPAEKTPYHNIKKKKRR